MSEYSTIEWTDHTFNPWLGCSKVSPGCDHCYAEHWMNTRLHKVAWGPRAPRVRTASATWRAPVRWNARHAAFFDAYGRRQRVFCASFADVFDTAVPTQWRLDLAALILRTPSLDWQLLTKRIGNAKAMLAEMFPAGPPDHVWLGATVVNQLEAGRDIPKLLATPARVKFLSMEPLLGPVTIRDWLTPGYPHCRTGFVQGEQLVEGYCGTCGGHISDPIHAPQQHDWIDWVIAGGESGRAARPVHPDWVRSLRDQCKGASVPFFFKQWGEWRPRHDGESYSNTYGWGQRVPVFIVSQDGACHCVHNETTQTGAATMLHVGRRQAGNLLDGVAHQVFPQLEETTPATESGAQPWQA